MKNRSLLNQYWFKFKTDQSSDWFIVRGCGVTAYSYDDAVHLLTTKIFRDVDMPEIVEVKENLDIRTLDQNHKAFNIKDPTIRGVWYPPGFDF